MIKDGFSTMKQIVMSITALLLVAVLSVGCAPASNLDARLEPIVSQHRFSIAGWEWQTLVVQPVSRSFLGSPRKDIDEAAVVKEYDYIAGRVAVTKSRIASASESEQKESLAELEEILRLDRKTLARLAPEVERIIRKQIRETLNEQGIYNPTSRGEISFPPLSFKLEELPLVLVISPRDRIESIREIVLQSGIPIKEQEIIEARVDKLGVSSLVDRLGGIATYPSMVDSGAGLRSAVETAAHEWLHHYLAFTPLGFRYILDQTGIVRNYDIATMNESLANMFGKEIGEVVLKKYYPGYENDVNQTNALESSFNLEMREIRKTVDVYLARGEVEQAEAFMERKRQELALKGYYIRKLNQAYFAFHGTYADDPAFLSPIGLELKELRAKSASLKEFLDKVAGMTSRQDLTESIR